MKTIPASLQTHIAQEVTTLATLWTITRRDGVVLRLTDHDAPITVAGSLYASAVGYQATTLQSESALSVPNQDAEVLLDDAGITDSDLHAGLYDGAVVQIDLVNWSAPSDGTVTLHRGRLGEVTTMTGRARAELRGLTEYLQHTIGRMFALRCDADLGDTRCGVALASHTVSGTVSTVVAPRRSFTGSAVPAAVGGLLTWTSGANSGRSMDVSALSGSTMTLAVDMPFDIVAGDGYSVYRGCDKNLSTCRDAFSNQTNFRGFPHIPGTDKALKYPDAH